MTTRFYGLIGFPLEHSFSASYFSSKFKKEGIKAKYINFPLKEISEFPELIRSNQGLGGLNVTVPYKEAIIPFLDSLSMTARTIRAVNTIHFCRSEHRGALIGHNTDVIGFRRSLEEHIRDQHNKALVLGTGGSSKAIRYVLEEMGIPCRFVSRKKGENRLSYQELNKGIMKEYRLIINTTPLGMYPDVDSYPDIPYDMLTPEHLLFDLVYNPEQTRFLAKGDEKWASTVNGYDMPKYQAEASWEIWNRGKEK
jgi:shikimate dehydrogenase